MTLGDQRESIAANLLMRALCIVPLRKEGAGSGARKRCHNAECGHMNSVLRWGKSAGAWALGLPAVRIARIGAPSNPAGPSEHRAANRGLRGLLERRRPITARRRVPECHFVLPISAGADRECAPEAIARIGRVRFGTFREYSATGTVGAQLKSSERAEHGGP